MLKTPGQFSTKVAFFSKGNISKYNRVHDARSRSSFSPALSVFVFIKVLGMVGKPKPHLVIFVRFDRVVVMRQVSSSFLNENFLLKKPSSLFSLLAVLLRCWENLLFGEIVKPSSLSHDAVELFVVQFIVVHAIFSSCLKNLVLIQVKRHRLCGRPCSNFTHFLTFVCAAPRVPIF